MPGIDEPGPPPEVPDEYAAVYRDAYRRALDEPDPAADDIFTLGPAADRPPPARFGPLLIGGLAVLAICVALGVSMLSGGDDDSPTVPVDAASATPKPSKAPSKAPSRTPRPSPSVTAAGPVWDGPVNPVAVTSATATCTSSASVDGAGTRVEYVAANTIDADPTTAWRCDGDAVGASLTLVLPAGTEVGELGLIPGYAKIDPSSGADRFTENNRITKVRWTLADGTEIVQELDPTQRTVQYLRIPRTASGTVNVQVLAVDQGSRNRTAISEIVVSAAG